MYLSGNIHKNQWRKSSCSWVEKYNNLKMTMSVGPIDLIKLNF